LIGERFARTLCPGCPGYLAPVAALLPDTRTVRFDQRGVGTSQAMSDTYGVDDYLDDIEAVRRHLGIERWHVFGHSWGGLLAQLTPRRTELVP
jgi:proline iminopeptidase